MSYRIGKGYDVHQIKSGEKLILGGVSIPYEKGVVAHSDGDILSHAIIDSLLGALALGDIGTLFPNSKEWKNLIEKDGILFDLKGIIPRDLAPIRIWILHYQLSKKFNRKRFETKIPSIIIYAKRNQRVNLSTLKADIANQVRIAI